MDWIRLINTKQTKLRADDTRSSVPIHGTLQWPRLADAHNNTTHPNRNKRHRHNLNLPTIALALFTCVPTYAQTDVGGVSATANPIANSTGSVTNQAIQVLQGPYVTSQMGDGISCQGATFNFTPYITGNISQQHPYEPIYQDPVYNNVDANDDGVPDNPGEILYYVPTRTGQKNNTINGVTSTWTGLDLSTENKPNFVQTTPGAAFQFTEHYSGPGLQTHTIIQRTQTVTSVTDTTSIFQQ